MKELPSPTVHLAISIVDRYMLHCKISRARVQLLGITALLLASRWALNRPLTRYHYDVCVCGGGVTLNGENT